MTVDQLRPQALRARADAQELIDRIFKRAEDENRPVSDEEKRQIEDAKNKALALTDRIDRPTPMPK